MYCVKWRLQANYVSLSLIYYMGCCEDYLTCDIAFNAVMPLSRASTRGRYSRIDGVTDWVHNLRIIFIVAQKNYVLEALLGVPPAPATTDIVNAWQSRVDDYSIV